MRKARAAVPVVKPGYKGDDPLGAVTYPCAANAGRRRDQEEKQLAKALFLAPWRKEAA